MIQARIAPCRSMVFGDQMMQRLVGRLHPRRRHAGGHRFDALSPTGKQQAGAIGSERRRPVGVPERCRQRLDIGGEP